ncbi:MAG TPA: SpoIID/LytB domain-containing protein [Tenuifilaceae bacterium]|nr:SpoIID/LytB domain-containing protein [Tenuifilaceae bacterium]
MKHFFLVFFTFISTITLAQKLNISLFNEENLQTLLITPVSGSYLLIYGDNEYILYPNQIIYISRSNDSIKVRDMATNLGTWKRVSLVGRTGNDVIRINPVSPSIPARIYDDNLGFYVDFNRMMVINLIDQEKYVAAVVEAESGPSAHIEFYKAQSLLVRTYALGHMEKHAGEGFNLCDEVHCQVYKGKSTKNPEILKAANETKGQVVVDTSKTLIVGAFHANCGGQTANSGDVWITPQPYLSSVVDPYCTSQRNAKWEVKIPLQAWLDFLKSKGVQTEELTHKQIEFHPKERVYKYTIGNVSIPMKEIRTHFNLRSAFFTVDVVSDFVKLKGRGYGHGVGMCQDGAMQMAKRGKTYEEIVKFYFKNVEIVKFLELNNYSHEEEILSQPDSTQPDDFF